MRTVLRIMIGLMLVYVALCGALFVFQRSLIYFPQPDSADSGVGGSEFGCCIARSR
jgi:hypothetical protein